jgi:4-hydroxy-tetrahydrodipicolinate synthase
MRFEGAYTAIVTPMLEDGGVDYAGLAKNIEFQIAQGISGVVAVGTTGESPTLNWEEHDRIIEQTIEIVAGRCTVIAGTGSNATDECIASTEHAAKAGADAALLVDCYYNGPSSQELRDHYYSAVAERLPNLPLIPYVIPGRSGTAIAAEDVAILAARHPNITTVKEATGDLGRMARTRELCGAEFSILSGDDDLTFTMLTDPAVKANGTISVATNVVPGATQKMIQAVLSGDLDTARKLQNALAPLFGVVTVKVENERVLPDGSRVMVSDKYRNPLAIKTMMTALGMPSGLCRKPLGKMSAAGVAVVRDAVKKVWNYNPEVLQPIAEFYGIDITNRLSNDEVWASLTA